MYQIRGELMGATLYEKVFDEHVIRKLPGGQYQLFIDLHLINDITSPQGFALLREKGLSVKYPERSFAVCDHMNPTDTLRRPFSEEIAEVMITELENNCEKYNIRYFYPQTGDHGITHVVGPEMGLTQPGMTICCGDSHTSTHGAFGSIAFGIGASQICDILATQTMAIDKLKVRRIEINGQLPPGVYAKDVALYIIHHLGVKGGIGYTYEYAGEIFDNFSMDERMTVCNLSIEAGARCGYINPDHKTYAYLKGREFVPQGSAWDKAIKKWESIKSDPDARYDDVVRFHATNIQPFVTWGITPGQSIPIYAPIPEIDSFPEHERFLVKEALEHMGFVSGQKILGTPIDVAFIGSCTNGRYSDFEQVAHFLQQTNATVAPHVRALIVPGSERVRLNLVEHGYDKVFEQAGFEFRNVPGCSLCIGMNPDHLEGRQICASSSNRNFKGRQGAAKGRTILMSPVMVAAAAIAGKVVDARETFGIK
jgi:3-isopropylmalate/(R)-2-methylmalate dehydratase large subunit